MKRNGLCIISLVFFSLFVGCKNVNDDSYSFTVEDKDGITFTLEKYPDNIASIQYIIETETDSQSPAFSAELDEDLPYTYVFPFVDPGKKYKCSMRITRIRKNSEYVCPNDQEIFIIPSSGLGESKIDFRKTAKGKFENGILKITDIPDTSSLKDIAEEKGYTLSLCNKTDNKWYTLRDLHASDATIEINLENYSTELDGKYCYWYITYRFLYNEKNILCDTFSMNDYQPFIYESRGTKALNKVLWTGSQYLYNCDNNNYSIKIGAEEFVGMNENTKIIIEGTLHSKTESWTQITIINGLYSKWLGKYDDVLPDWPSSRNKYFIPAVFSFSKEDVAQIKEKGGIVIFGNNVVVSKVSAITE